MILVIMNSPIKNIWTSNVIFLEDSDNKIYVIGYNRNKRLGINFSGERFIFYKQYDIENF